MTYFYCYYYKQMKSRLCSYYDSKAWDEILQENMGDVPLLDAGAQEGAPKVTKYLF